MTETGDPFPSLPEIAADISVARTLPGWVYGHPGVYGRLLERAYAPSWQPLEPAVDRLRKQYPSMSDDERVLRFMYAGNQVDTMLAGGAMKTEYEFEAPLVRLVRELADRKYSKVYFGSAG